MRIGISRYWRVLLGGMAPVVVVMVGGAVFTGVAGASIGRAERAPAMEATVDRVRPESDENGAVTWHYWLTVTDPRRDTHFTTELWDRDYQGRPDLAGKVVQVRVDPQDQSTVVWADDPLYDPDTLGIVVAALGGAAVLTVAAAVLRVRRSGH